MSVAFTKEGDSEAFAADLPDRPISSQPNLVTPEGAGQIEAELAEARAAYSAAQTAGGVADGDRTAMARATRDLRYWSARRATAQLTERLDPPTVVQFGDRVTFDREDGRVQTFRIVGEDEADPDQGLGVLCHPFARALLGKVVGDVSPAAGRRGRDHSRSPSSARIGLSPHAAMVSSRRDHMFVSPTADQPFDSLARPSGRRRSRPGGDGGRDPAVRMARERQADFAGLLKMIVQQQVSLASAAAIWARVEAGLPEMTPDRRDGARGLSICRAWDSRGPRPATPAPSPKPISRALRLRRPAPDVRRRRLGRLTAVNGIGRWTAEVYLMFTQGDWTCSRW
jgi:transcription elongation GreA/GreB family factor